jgi:hypothetical protein
MEEYSGFWELLSDIRKDFPRFRIVKREESKLIKFIYTVFFMKWWHESFLDSYVTTIGSTCYMPSSLFGTHIGYMFLQRALTNRIDSKKYSLLYYLSYILFPIGPSPRSFWEFRGYCSILQAEYGFFGHVKSSVIDYYSGLFCDNSYLWMFPSRRIVRKLFLLYCFENSIPVQ